MLYCALSGTLRNGNAWASRSAKSAVIQYYVISIDTPLLMPPKVTTFVGVLLH